MQNPKINLCQKHKEASLSCRASAALFCSCTTEKTKLPDSASEAGETLRNIVPVNTAACIIQRLSKAGIQGAVGSALGEILITLQKVQYNFQHQQAQNNDHHGPDELGAPGQCAAGAKVIAGDAADGSRKRQLVHDVAGHREGYEGRVV